MRGPLPYRVVDAFTDRPFSGNPAAVVLPGAARGDRATDAERAARGQAAHPDGATHGDRAAHGDPPPDDFLQAIAAEMNLSETAFPSEPDASGVRRLRWFTPTTEVSLCGHATLAAAHALLEEGAEAPIRFESLSGPLTVDREEDGRLGLDFPADTPRELDAPDGLLDALGLPTAGPAAPPFLTGRRCAVVPLADAGELADLEPDMRALREVRLPGGVMGVSATAPAEEAGLDFVSRFFGPWVGVPEDPVTGMAHCALGPYWARRLGRAQLEARQGSRRGGRLAVHVERDRVKLLGRAVTVARGELLP